ncbi:MAG TPA: tetratricopeptide repeat protein [Anaeromyxobacteraceae bacterium]|nr:tetratricopeptide repeat protein [Anaeromyxobacteraceae bacterium]
MSQRREKRSRRAEAEPAVLDPVTFKGVRAEWIVLGAAFVLAIAAYARILHGEFQLDDFQTVVGNTAIKDLGGMLSRFAGALFHAGRPVTDLTFALNWQVGGLVSFGYHLVNLAIHLGNVVLVFLFTRTVLGLAGAARPPLTAAVVSAIFALHPIQTQAVSYVTQRAEILASGLYLGALLLLLGAERRGRTPLGVLQYVAGFLVFLVGLGAKVILVTLPVVYLALVWLVPSPRARASLTTWPRRLALVAPWLALDLFMSTRTVQSFGASIHVGFSIPGIPPVTYFLTQWRVLVTYLRLLLFPYGQSLDWFYPVGLGLGDLATLEALAVLLAVAGTAVALVVAFRRRDDDAGGAARAAGFGLLWFFLVLAPTSSVIPLVDVIEEHRVYLATWGIFTALTLGGGRLLLRVRPDRRRTVGAAVVAVLLCVLAGLAWHRNGAWTTRIALWTSEVAAHPQNFRAHANLAFAYDEQGRYEDALREYLEALHGSRNNPQNEWLLRNNVAAMLMQLGRLEEARVHLERVIQLRPDDPDPIVNLGRIYLGTGDAARAEALAQRALQVNPAHTHSMNLLGKIRMQAGDPEGAFRWYQRAAQVNPDETSAWLNMGQVLNSVGRTQEACQMWRRAASSPMPSRYRDDAVRILAASRCPR